MRMFCSASAEAKFNMIIKLGVASNLSLVAQQKLLFCVKNNQVLQLSPKHASMLASKG